MTLNEIHNIALQLSRKLIYRHYVGPEDTKGSMTLLEDVKEIPLEAATRAHEISNWFMDSLFYQDSWVVSTTNGTVTRLLLDKLLDFSHGYRISHFHYNPITTIGPPPPEWSEFYSTRWLMSHVLINYKRGIVNRPTVAQYIQAIEPLSFVNRRLGRLIAKFRRGARFEALFLAHKFGGRSLCMKSSDVNQWAEEIEGFLDAFLIVEAHPSKDNEDKFQIEGRSRGRPLERRKIATAILELYGSAEREKPWKELHRDTESYLGESFSMSSLKRAFNDLTDNDQGCQNS